MRIVADTNTFLAVALDEPERRSIDKVLEGLSAFKVKGKVLQTSLTKDKQEELRNIIENAA